MKILLTAGVVFTPGSQTLDFSGVSGFDLGRLYGVINATAGSKLYAPGIAGFGYQSFANGVLTLQADTSQMAAGDELLVAYESPDAQKVDGSGFTQPVSAVALPLPAGAAKDSSLQAILAAIQAQRVETIWTDDTGTRFIRNDSGGTITWTDVAGNASAAPGTGARPDSDSGTVVSRYTYRATAAGTGFASGDFLDHVVVTDGDAGDLVSNFWVNVTAGTKIAAPSAASITPLAPLPDGAATSAKQDTGNTSLASLLTGLGAPADTAATSDAGSFSLVALAKRALGNWTTLLTRIPALVSGRMPVDGSGVTQPVSAAALPLPAGAAQDGADPASPAVANGGTGIRGWLATIAGQLGGSLKVVLQTGANTIGAVSQSGTWSVNATLQSGSALPTGAATSANQATEITALGTPADAAYAGTGSPSIIAALKGVYTALLAATPAGTNLIGKVNVAPATSGGLSLANYFATGTGGQGQIVKAAPGQLYRIHAFNTDTTWAYLKIFNKASAPTLGTDPAVAVFAIPPGGVLNAGSADLGEAFSNGIFAGLYGDAPALGGAALSTGSKCGYCISYA